MQPELMNQLNLLGQRWWLQLGEEARKELKKRGVKN
jgi:hypothetical protein